MNQDVLIKAPSGASTLHFGLLAELDAWVDPERTVVVADDITRGFVPACFKSEKVLRVERGEACKTPESLVALWRHFSRLGVTRDWSVVGLGGGCVTDLAGFAAATWLRGLDYGSAPTTLLAMVDASVGGKCGINLDDKKNQAGVIRQPRFALMDTSVLASLGEDDMASGFVEALKHGILEGHGHLALVEAAIASPRSPALEAAIRASVLYKARIVEADESETGQRKLLNLGHTFGHAIEAACGLPHGQSVAAGLACALRLAEKKGAGPELGNKVLPLLAALGLPTSLGEARAHRLAIKQLSRGEFLARAYDALAADKKRTADGLCFILPYAEGDVRMETVTIPFLRDFLREAP